MTTTDPRIAVLMPAYNAGPDLEQTLDSLRRQDEPARLYLIDDGSSRKPNYQAIIKGLDCRLIALPRNLGITGAMNAGLKEILKGRYEYVARIDAGDVAISDRFSKQAHYLDIHPDVAIVGSAIRFSNSDSNGAVLGERIMTFPATPEECQAAIYSNSPVCHPAILVRREVYEKLNGYSEDYPAAEDYDLMWRAMKAGFHVGNLPDILLLKDENPDSISQSRRRRQIVSRLRLQWKNFNPQVLSSWTGIAKGLAVLAMPRRLVIAVKHALKG